jgi:peptidoglycan/LPS O-acetylase OafA/YrhL
VVIAAAILHRAGMLSTSANTVFSNVFVFEITLLISWGLLIAALDDESWLTRILNIRWLRGIGIISYSMYLIHLTVLSVCRDHFHNAAVVFCLTFAGTILYSALSWRFIESKLLKRRRRAGVREQAVAAKL